MKKYALSLLVAILSLNLIYAASVNQDVAKRLAYNFLNDFLKHQTVLSYQQLRMVAHYGSNVNGKDANCFYIFNISKPKGFVIVSADDRILPILAYSVIDTFNIDNTPANVSYILNGYKAQISEEISGNTSQSIEVRRQWNVLLENQISSTNRSTFKDPLIKTQWNQGKYFNTFCPGGSYTGCVATTMAQIMRYWKHPLKGKGSHSYYHSFYGNLSANFGNTSYAWNLMPEVVNIQNDPVSLIMFHCGVSVEMDYSTSGSGAYSRDAMEALINYFSYNSGAEYIYRDNYTSSEWIELMKRELDHNRPTYYAGRDYNSGHAFIVDGYDRYGLFHINWGWGGKYDGYFSIDDLTPGTIDFYFDHRAIIGIQPQYLPDRFEVNNALQIASPILPNFKDSKSETYINEVNLHDEFDRDYYKIILEKGSRYEIAVQIFDANTNHSGLNFSGDSRWRYFLNNKWSLFMNKESSPINIKVDGGSELILQIESNNPGDFGTYEIELNAIKSAIPPILKGSILTVSNKPVPNATVSLLRGSTLLNRTTDLSGQYSFTDLIPSETYLSLTEKIDDPLNGVSTQDIVIIQKHILGRESIGNPYRLLAADVNNSKSITSADISEIRKLILGIIPKFKAHESWRFIPTHTIFQNNTVPWNDSIHYNIRMDSYDNEMNFVGIKMGDLNESVQTIQSPAERYAKDLQRLDVEVKELGNGKYYLNLYLQEKTFIDGIQMGIELRDRNMIVRDVISELIQMDESNWNIVEGENVEFRFSWSNGNPVVVGTKLPLISILIESETAPNSSSFVLSGIPSEICFENKQSIPIIFNWDNGIRMDLPSIVISDSYFSQDKIIFKLNSSTDIGQGILTLYSLGGRQVYNHFFELFKGSSTIELPFLTSSTLHGIYFIQVSGKELHSNTEKIAFF